MPGSFLGLCFLLVIGAQFPQWLNSSVLLGFLGPVFLSPAFVELDVELCNGCWDVPRTPFMNTQLFPEVLATDCSQWIFFSGNGSPLMAAALPGKTAYSQQTAWTKRWGGCTFQPQCLNSRLLWRVISALELKIWKGHLLKLHNGSPFPSAQFCFPDCLTGFLWAYFPINLLQNSRKSNLRVCLICF